MYGIRPEILTTEELVKYAWLEGPERLPAIWVQELIKRLEQTLDDNK
jgi:hypothetical protein